MQGSSLLPNLRASPRNHLQVSAMLAFGKLSRVSTFSRSVGSSMSEPRFSAPYPRPRPEERREDDPTGWTTPPPCYVCRDPVPLTARNPEPVDEPDALREIRACERRPVGERRHPRPHPCEGCLACTGYRRSNKQKASRWRCRRLAFNVALDDLANSSGLVPRLYGWQEPHQSD